MGGHHHEDDRILSDAGRGLDFGTVVERTLTRRGLLKGGMAALVLGAGAGVLASRSAAPGRSSLGFTAIQGDLADAMKVPAGYRAKPLIRWGDPLTASAPAFRPGVADPAGQKVQFGYNCDFVGFYPSEYGKEDSTKGLLVVNHEYTNPEIMFANYDAKQPAKDQADVELEAHGISVVEIELGANGEWTYDRAGKRNRRVTATTEMEITGPAAGHDRMKTLSDKEGRKVFGMLNNCSAGKTPWGTVLTAEENFYQYFAHLDGLDKDHPSHKNHVRYGIPEKESERKWERFYDRFDVRKDPNEPNRFGWVVEIDPYDPTFVPKKRTALGRFRHEAATTVISKAGNLVLYSGDDQLFEYVYKFVSFQPYNKDNREANFRLLDEGRLYVAKFNDDGSGEWLPLVHGEGPLTAENGFASQGDVLIDTRLAADLLGATKMDRPEDIETSPKSGKVYIVLTKNAQRGVRGQIGIDKANPRSQNKHGHIIELTEDENDHAATRFTWNIFLLCGDPDDESTYFAGFDKSKVSPISCPDNITFDLDGNLWISTDGQPDAIKINDGLFAVPVEGEERGYVRQFFSSVKGAEVCGPEFTPDNTTLFVAVQHPGEGGTFEKPISSFPDGSDPPRPSVVAIRAEDGRRVGTSAADDASQWAGTLLSPLAVVESALGAVIKRREENSAN